MPRKGDRTVAPRIMSILGENNRPMRWIEIFKAITQHGWFHTQKPIADNLKYLISEDKIVKVGIFYGIPLTRKNGSKYIVIRNVVGKDETIELGK